MHNVHPLRLRAGGGFGLGFFDDVDVFARSVHVLFQMSEHALFTQSDHHIRGTFMNRKIVAMAAAAVLNPDAREHRIRSGGRWVDLGIHCNPP